MQLVAIEKRIAPRVPVQRAAVIASEGAEIARCVMTDFNEYGARLDVGDETPPDRFVLIELGAPVAYSLRVMWRKAPWVGTRFETTWDLDAADAPASIKQVRSQALRKDGAERGIKLVHSRT